MRGLHPSGVAHRGEQVCQPAQLPRQRRVGVSARGAEEVAAAEVRLGLAEPGALFDDAALQDERLADAPPRVELDPVDGGAAGVHLPELDCGGRWVVRLLHVEQIAQ
jgi:hypothetical protein